MRIGIRSPATQEGPITERHKDMTTSNFYILAKPLQPAAGIKGQSGVPARQLSVARPKAETEPEERLWKLCAEAASPRLSGFEWIAILLLVE